VRRIQEQHPSEEGRQRKEIEQQPLGDVPKVLLDRVCFFSAGIGIAREEWGGNMGFAVCPDGPALNATGSVEPGRGCVGGVCQTAGSLRPHATAMLPSFPSRIPVI
jgi:hypothetical protein